MFTFHFVLKRLSLSLLPHLISELGNEANAVPVFVTREERKIKRM